MRAIQSGERIAAQQDINAAINPMQWQGFRLHLGDEAYEADSPEYERYVTSIAGEQSVSFSG